MSSFSTSGAVSGAITGAVIGFKTGTGVYGAVIGGVIGFFVGGFGVADMQRKARNRARDAWNNAQRDRQLTIQSATAPHKIIYGRDRVGGTLAYAQASGANGEFLHLVVALAGHECDAIETVYLGETALTLDGSGFATNPEFSVFVYTQDSASFSTSGVTLVLANTPTRVISVARSDGESGDQGYTSTPVDYTLAGSTITLAAAMANGVYLVFYEYVSSITPLVRVRKYLGTATQAADADLVAESGGKWTAAHQLRGICYVYVRLQYDQDIFAAVGRPDVLALVRGRKLLDPRTGTTVWSGNAALCTADYLRNYMGAAAAEVPSAELIAQADICDQLVTTTVGGATQSRYTVNGTLSTETAPRDNLEALLEAMAGTCVWVQGRYLLRAGAHQASELTITDDLLADGAITIQQGAQRSELVNRIVPLYQEPARLYSKVEAPAVTNATYVSDDGGLDLPLEVHYDLCDNSLRAQRMAKIALERARQGLRVQINCNLRAYDLAPGSTVALTLARYGWSGKEFVVLERSHSFETQTVALTLQETAAAVWNWNYGEATTVDLTPNTALPSPWARPPALTGLAMASGTAHLLRLKDGTVQCRALVSWTASTDINVLQGGQIRVRWRQGSDAWVDGGFVSGNSSQAIIGPLREGQITVVGLLPTTQLGREADQWSFVKHVPVGESAAPAGVTGLAWATRGLQVVISWAASTEADYDFTELRIGASWAAGTALEAPGPTRVSGSSFNWSRPANGAYIVWAAHRDASGNYSATPASLAVTVAAAIDSGYTNASIAINGTGQITGIGTGAGTAVSNSLVGAANLATVGWWNASGAVIPWVLNGAYNYIHTTLNAGVVGPKGGSDVVWYAGNDTGSTAGPAGGWDSGTHTALDPAKTYRFVVPIQRLDGTAGAYWGTGPVCDLNTTIPESGGGGAYFCQTNALTLGRWHLFVGYLFPVGATGNTNDGAGIIDCTTGAFISGGQNFNQRAGYPSPGHRAYQYYASLGAHQVFGRPMINLVDGTEPSLREYLGPDAVLNSVAVAAAAIDATAKAGVAATTANYGGVSNRPTTYRVVSAGWNAVTTGSTPAAPAIYNAETGTTLAGVGGPYTVAKINRATGAFTSVGTYSTLGAGGDTEATRMAADLTLILNDHVVVVYCADEPQTNRTAALKAAMYRCGASAAVFGSDNFQYRSAYVLIGIPGCGEGNGAEGYQGAISSDPNAWVDMSFTVLGGNIVGVSNAYTPRTLADYGYIGDPNANYTTNTDELTDGANLGGTANWNTVAGIPKSASSNVVIDYGSDAEPAAGSRSAIMDDASATGGKALKVWSGWTSPIYINRANGAHTVKGLIQGKTYKVFARVKFTANAQQTPLGIYNYATAANWGGYIPRVNDGLWRVVQLADFVPNWDSAAEVVIYHGEGDGLAPYDNPANYALIDWVYFQPVNAEEGATVGATAGSNLRDSGGTTLGDADVRNNVDGIIRAPGGGALISTVAARTGAIKVALPVGFTNTMLRFVVDVYEYATGYMCSIEVGGYPSGANWYNVSAHVIGGSNVEYPVYFGSDGTKACVWIGGSAETWSYPQVRVRDVFVSYFNYTRAMWEAGWQISFDPTVLTVGTGANQYSAAVIDTLPGADWAKTARKPTTLAGINTTEGTKLTGIAAGATVGARAGVDLLSAVGAVISDAALLNSYISVTATGALSNGSGTGGQIQTLPVLDRDRGIDRPPSYYPTGTTREFKQSSTFGLYVFTG